jgi:putative transposon-encoded protein
MSREKPKLKYQAKVVKYSNGARIKAYKEHIGKTVEVRVMKDGN